MSGRTRTTEPGEKRGVGDEEATVLAGAIRGKGDWTGDDGEISAAPSDGPAIDWGVSKKEVTKRGERGEPGECGRETKGISSAWRMFG